MDRTPFMQMIWTESYKDVAVEAIKTRFEGSWERCVARLLKKYVEAGHSEAEVLLQAAEGNHLRAAYLITSSKIPDHANV
jgi:hypothetical protein